MTKRKTLSRVLALARYGLLAAAVVYLCMTVRWYDHVVLTEGGRVVRLLEDRSAVDGELVVRVAGEPQTVGVDDVKLLQDGVIDIKLGISSVLRTLNVPTALWALLIFLPVPLLQSLRLVWMLKIQEVPLRYFASVKLSFVGNFFNFALPGTTGGDLIKAYYLTQYTHRKTEAVTTVFLDRVVGMISLITLATAMIIVTWEDAVIGAWAWMLAALFAGLVCGAIVVLSARLRQALGLRRLAEMLPAGEHLVRIGRTMVQMGRHPVRVVGCIGLTLLLQIAVFVSGFVMARALGMDGDLTHYLVFLPIGFMIASIPITPQGLGVMETAFIQFFTGPAFNNDASQALALALALRITQLLWSLPGGLVPLFGAHVPRGAELEAFEHSEEGPLPDEPTVPPQPTPDARSAADGDRPHLTLEAESKPHG